MCNCALYGSLSIIDYKKLLLIIMNIWSKTYNNVNNWYYYVNCSRNNKKKTGTQIFVELFFFSAAFKRQCK